MKYLEYFFGFFILFFIVGLIWGYMQDVDFGNPHVLKHLVIEKDSTPIAILLSDSHFIKYQCDKSPTYAYNIDKNKLEVQKGGMQAIQAGSGQTVFSSSDYALISAFVGGPTGGVTWRSMRAVWKQGGVKKFIFAAAGLVSGLFVGRGVAAYLFSSCDSKKVIAYLSKEENWPAIERELAIQYIEEVEEACKKNRPFQANSLLIQPDRTSWNNLLNRVAVYGYDFTSSDFLVIDKERERCNSLLSSFK